MQSGCMNSWLCHYLTEVKNVLDVHPVLLIGITKVITAHIVGPTCEVNKMSYRLIDSNAIAIKHPEVNEMPCVFADLPDGLHGQFIDTQPERKKGRWIITDTDSCYCSECKKDPISFVNDSEFWWLDKMPNFCPHCGADMRGKQDG